MSELVKRYRLSYNGGLSWELQEDPECEYVEHSAFEAHAARIERLVAALRSFRGFGCPICGGDCASANPPVSNCPMQAAAAALKENQT